MIFINDMTRLSSPATSEYNFQLVESYNSNTLTLQSILQNGLDMDMIDVIAKVIYKDKESQIVGSMKLKKSTCYIADETANSKLILWENNIEDLLVTYTKDVCKNTTGVPTSKYRHLWTSALFRNFPNVRIWMEKKLIISVNCLHYNP